MKLTKAHVDFYVYKIGPDWVRATYKEPPLVPIPQINSDPHYCKSNTLSILRSVRKREGMAGVRLWLRRMAQYPGTTISPGTRAACSRKWLARLEEI